MAVRSTHLTPTPMASRLIQVIGARRATLAFLMSSAAIGLTGCEQKRPAPSAASPAAPAAATGTDRQIPAQVPPRDGILSRVAREIGDILGKPSTSITADQDLFKDLGADSLDAVEIVMALEEEFKLVIDDASAEKMRTVADIVTYLRNQTKP